MSYESFTNMRSLLNALAISMNLINRDMEHHHEQTAYLAYQIGLEMGLESEALHDVIYGALLHDIGAVISPEPQNIQEIESHGREIAAIGAKMLEGLEGFETVAAIIETNQNSYQENRALFEENCENSETCLDIAQAIHLADVVTSLFHYDQPILNQVKGICDIVQRFRGTEFSPKALDAFLRLSKQEYIWLDMALNPQFLMVFAGDIRPISLDEAVKLTKFMSRIIDYRSSFTAMHSAGVAASARCLAELAGMDEETCKKMTIAGYLHDVGKLRVPNSILEKPGKLTEEEFNIVKEHTYYTRWILMDIDGFEQIADWAGFHHEKLNGNGYPFHIDASELDLGSRIMAVADIFSAITEIRPYRAGMDRERALAVLRQNVENGAICGEVVRLLEENYETVDSARDRESREAGQRYFRSLAEKKADRA